MFRTDPFPSDAASALNPAAEVAAPEVSANYPVRPIEFSDEVPSVIKKPVCACRHVHRAVPGRDDLLNPPAAIVISEVELLLRAARHRAQRLHAHEPILAVPSECPATIIRLVAAGVITVGLRGCRHKHIAAVGAAA